VSIRGRNASRVAANLVRPADTGRGLRVAPSSHPTPTHIDKARAEGAASRGRLIPFGRILGRGSSAGVDWGLHARLARRDDLLGEIRVGHNLANKLRHGSVEHLFKKLLATCVLELLVSRTQSG
jgi:hypothetical protein